MRHTPRKRFGQNFLVDSQVISDIARAIHPAEDDLLVEIGPGLGALTQPLLRLLKHLYVIEMFEQPDRPTREVCWRQSKWQ